jgi:hypothetical protein
MTLAMRNLRERGRSCVGNRALLPLRQALVALLGLASIAATAEVPSLQKVRFSPDGRYVLAQDDSRITILTVQPFRVLFWVPAQNARLAEFTPDSREFAFITGGIRRSRQQLALSESPGHVKRWSVSAPVREESTEVPLKNCPTLELSPDGHTLVGVDFDGNLRVVDLSSGTTVFVKRKFGQVFLLGDGLRDTYVLGDPGSARLRFSPDGRFLVMFPVYARGETLILDLHSRTAAARKGGLRKLQRGYCFTFTKPDRIVFTEAVLGHALRTATIVAVPSGKVLQKTKLPQGPLFRAANPRWVLIHPYGPWAVDGDPDDRRACAAELSTGFAITSETPALDVYGNHYVAERRNGELGLYVIGQGLEAALSLQDPGAKVPASVP